ncbi:Holliday junction resolvase RuvX [Paracrocinitomix mangrovi]|uniref:Holliday junction resolvase RuvX n=1 Tax=Paracrocinitomix mangrovi TaxID=2862509 RepID=UPI001C8F137F|nr:Holliday junction resolvase RuvX [Paracrocinitomix mangrovi]UKN02940.1 Holliday junction resolvase RuvX [Paracrocinitomix mangrovi]
MAKIIALDYGKKRTGIAATDELQIIASGLTTVDTKQLFDFLKDYLSKNQVESIVLGEPKKLDGTDTHSSEDVRKLKDKLGTTFGLPVHMVDERFTSKMAFQTMIDSGLKKKQRQNKALVDEISATIILQSYLETKR